MPKHRDFARLDALPANFVDALTELLGMYASPNFEVRVRPADPTILEVVAGVGNDQVALGIEGKWRYITATVSRGGISGAARTLDVFAVTGANSFTPGTPGEIDLTDYAFDLRIAEVGVPPAGFAHTRRIATAMWDGLKFSSVRVLFGPREAVVPTGTLAATARSSAPAGWLLCDGAAVSRTTYAALFEAIGTAYGAGDGSTTFNLPDLRGRVPVGEDGSAGRLAANDARGQSGGAETVALTEAQLPAHDHAYTIVGTNATAHGHAGPGNPDVAQAAGSILIGAISGSTQVSTEDAGSGQAHNNLPPYQVVNWMVKA